MQDGYNWANKGKDITAQVAMESGITFKSEEELEQIRENAKELFKKLPVDEKKFAFGKDALR